MKRFLLVGFCLLTMSGLRAQTPLITDGLMMPKKDLGTGLYYGYDSWTKYWEGGLKRENGNIGTVNTQVVAFMGAYGVSDRLSAAVLLPYVSTKPTGGTLAGMSGLQDLSIMLKYNPLKADLGKSNIKMFFVGTGAIPLSNYTCDYLPLSIGLHCKSISGRFTTQWTYDSHWYAVGSASYTYRSNVFLDRPSYYTDGQLYNTNEVNMPDVFDFIFRAGYKKDMWHAELYYTQQNTLGGSDIRRQDMPFVSNRMNASKVGGSIMYAAPKLENIAFRVWGNYTVDGRNVGQSYTLTAGVMYFFHFAKEN